MPGGQSDNERRCGWTGRYESEATGQSCINCCCAGTRHGPHVLSEEPHFCHGKVSGTGTDNTIGTTDTSAVNVYCACLSTLFPLFTSTWTCFHQRLSLDDLPPTTPQANAHLPNFISPKASLGLRDRVFCGIQLLERLLFNSKSTIEALMRTGVLVVIQPGK